MSCGQGSDHEKSCISHKGAMTIYAVATCTVSVLRGTTVDPVYGDMTATMTVIASGIPCSIVEQPRAKVTTPGNPTPRVTRDYDGIIGSDVDVTDYDRLKDEKSGQIYVIVSVSQQALPGITSDQSLELRRLT
jgi:hypothetical protein